MVAMETACAHHCIPVVISATSTAQGRSKKGPQRKGTPPQRQARSRERVPVCLLSVHLRSWHRLRWRQSLTNWKAASAFLQSACATQATLPSLGARRVHSAGNHSWRDAGLAVSFLCVLCRAIKHSPVFFQVNFYFIKVKHNVAIEAR